MEPTILKTVTWGLPLTTDQVRFYLYPSLLLLLLIPIAIFYFLRHKRSRPFYPFSMADYSLKFTKDKLFQIEDRLSFVRLFTIILLLLTLPCPTLLTPSESSLFQNKELPPTEGSLLFIILDQSGSMEGKMGTLKDLTANFIKALDKDQPPQRKDLIGLMGFARYAWVLMPPTFEHDILLNTIRNFNVLNSKEGEGSSISYAIYKTAHLIQFLQESAQKAHFNLDSSAILLVTDGVEVISPEDVNKPYIAIPMDTAAAYAAKYHIPLYLTIIFPELNEPQYAPQKKSLEMAARKTGGELFILNSASELGGVLKKIEELKKVALAPGQAAAHLIEYPLWPPLLWIAFGLLLIYLYMEYSYYRMAP